MLISKTGTRLALHDDVVVVKLWEIYLLYHPSNLYKVLAELSIDEGPLNDQQVAGRVTFRFSHSDWEETVKTLLYEYRIPVNIQSNRLQALRVKGRQPVLR